MFDGLKFWKRKDEFDFGLDAPSDLKLDMKSDENPFFKDAGSFDSQNPTMPQSAMPKTNPFQEHTESPSPYSMQSFSEKSRFETMNPASPMNPSKDIELISSKLDTVKAMLENVISRLDRLEKEKEPAHKSQNADQRRWY